MTAKRDKQAVGQRLLAAFRDAGAVEVAPDILLPAGSLLDLYGEDIRARAYVTDDPLRGEMMLRPDFTVPVVQAHMANGAEPARYAYLGEVFRKQDHIERRPEHPRDSEYLQVGYEVFDRDRAAADIEVFALFHRLLAPFGLTATMGDMALIFDAVDGLPLSSPRRAALRHHIWRPQRFRRLIDRFSRPGLARSFADTAAPWTGARQPAEMQERIATLTEDAAQAPLGAEWHDRMERLSALSGPAPQALAALGELAAEWPALRAGADRLTARIAALATSGIDPATVGFDASLGRQTLEYYDGFTFTFTAPDHPDWPPVGTGGRYDALTAVLGTGRAIPAVGGIIRPGLVAELEASC
ncbi:ATP phosphoribosyltransferase regulatory subunit [Paracoccus pacificus]|uniref:ATP phosphoribosyltransferase regulatory subunit n=1 Tax=Paracoccus pacificus TaxID=1463598 RepID=A0ABW4R5V3_9RHOB